jgi:hypothetical protein
MLVRQRGRWLAIMPTPQLDIALSIFERIRAAFPSLAMDMDLQPEHVELAMDIPAQPGLSFRVYLNLQNNDELHLCASTLWVEWFPCTEPKKVDAYFEAVSGLLSGKFRILEQWRGKRAVKASLQRPRDGGWKTIHGSSHLLSIPWPPKTLKVVQNHPL